VSREAGRYQEKESRESLSGWGPPTGRREETPSLGRFETEGSDEGSLWVEKGRKIREKDADF